jgi:prophage antirepressor-like protein
LGAVRGAAGGVTKRLKALAADEIRVLRRGEDEKFPLADEPKANAITVIAESGLYKLILRAHPDRSPRVRAFQDWVTRDVLPAIRKDGAYVRGEELLKPGAVETLDLNDLDALRDRIETLMQRKAELLEQRLVAAVARVRRGGRSEPVQVHAR